VSDAQQPHPQVSGAQSHPDRRSWLERRRAKVVEEIARNRRGGHAVPTWVLAVILLAIVAGWAAVIILA
jgi:hypothetical protein